MFELLHRKDYSIPQGKVWIDIFSDDTLGGSHHCDIRMRPDDTGRMEFFRPSYTLSVLVCLRCTFRVEFLGLPQSDFVGKKQQITVFLDRRMALFNTEGNDQPSHEAYLVDRIRLELNPNIHLGPGRLRAWHCYDDRTVMFEGLRWIPMTVMMSGIYAILFCPACGERVRFLWNHAMDLTQTVRSLAESYRKEGKQKKVANR